MTDVIQLDGVPFIPLDVAAHEADLSSDYLYRLSRNGTIESRVIGRRRYVEQQSLQKFLIDRAHRLEGNRVELAKQRAEEYARRAGALPDTGQRASATGAMRGAAHPGRSGVSGGTVPMAAPALAESAIAATKKAVESTRTIAGETVKKGSGISHVFNRHSAALVEGMRESMSVTGMGDAALRAGLSGVHMPIGTVTPMMEFVHKLIALTLAFMLTFGTYSLVDPQYAKFALTSIEGNVRSVQTSYLSLTHGGVTKLASNADAQLAAAAENPAQTLALATYTITNAVPQTLATLAKSINTSVNGFVYAIAFPDTLVRSPITGTVDVHVTTYQHTTVASTGSGSGNGTGTTTGTGTSTASNGTGGGPVTVVQNPVIERIVEKAVPSTVVVAGGITEDELNTRLQQLDNKLSSQIFAITAQGSANTAAISSNYQSIATTQRIDTLANVSISGSRWSGGTISGADITGSSISATSLSVSGASNLATTTVTGDLTLSGSLLFTTSSSTISATTASTTNLLFTNATGTYAVLQDATTTGHAIFSGEARISDATATSTGNLYFGNNTARLNYNSSDYTFVGGSVYTNAGRIVSIGNNETIGLGVRYVNGDGTYFLGASHSFNPDLIFTNTSGAERARLTDGGFLGIGTTTPWAQLSLSSASGSPAFAIGSTTTQFIVDSVGNVGIGKSNPQTALDVVGNSYFRNTAGAVGSNDGVEIGTDSSAPRLSLVQGGRYVGLFSGDAPGNTYLKNVAGGDLMLYGGSGGNQELARLTNGGNFGIGTSSPFVALAVQGSGYFTGSLTAATTTLATTTISTLSIGGAQSSGSLTTSGNVTVGGNLTVNGSSVTLGTSTSNLLVVNSAINSNLVPNGNKIFDLGSPSYYWRNAYMDTITVNNISAASTSIGGTASNTFTINSDNATADAEDMSLIFFRGTVVPNALLTWNSAAGAKRFEFNQPLFIQNESGSTTQTTLTLKAVAGQTGNMLDIQNSSGSSLFSIGSTGATTIGGSLTVQGSLTSTLQASTTLFSSLGTAYFGTTATTTIDKAGNVNIAGKLAVGTVSPDASAIADFSTTTAGVLFPRLTSVQKSAIASPAAGLAIYDSTVNKLNVFNGTAWKNVGATEINGEVTNGTTGSVLFIGDGGVLGQDNANFSFSTSTHLLSLASASSSQLSVFQKAYFGGTATTTIDSTGAITVASNSKNTFPYASSTALTVSGQANLGSLAGAAVSSLSNNYVPKWNSASSIFGQSLIYDSGTQIGIGTNSNLNGALTANGTFGVQAEGDIFRQYDSGDATWYPIIARYNTANGTYPASTYIFGNGTNARVGFEVPGGGNLTTFQVKSATSWFNGNVGIGTTTPTQLLDVRGNSDTGTAYATVGSNGNERLRLGYNFTTNGITSNITAAQVVADGVGNLNLSSRSNAASGIMFFTNPGSGAAEAARITSAGNFGIGTTSPQTLLSLGNTTGNKIALWEDGSNRYGFGVQTNLLQTYVPNASADIAFGTGNSSAFSQLVTIKGTGNVGIGTTSPSTKLSVQGNGLFSGDLSLANLTATGTAYFAGNVGIGSSSPMAALVVNGSIFPQTHLGADNLGGVSNYWGTTYTNDLAVYNGSGIGIDTAGSDINFKSGSTQASRLFIQNSSGNIGAGTTSPFAKLSIHANAGDTNTALFAIASSTASATTTLFSIDNAGNLSATAGAATFASGSGFLSNGTLNLNSHSITNVDTVFGSNSPGTNLTLTTNNSTGNLILKAGSQSEYARITSAGLFGIGTTSPATTFAVAGDSFIAGNATTTGNGLFANSAFIGSTNSFPGVWLGSSALTPSTSNYSLLYDSGFGSILNAPTGKNIYFRINNSTQGIITSAGNVGIGTTTPTNKLHVYNGALEVSGAYVSPIAGQSSVVLSQESTFGQLQTFNSKPLALNPLGNNVGIGTTTPTNPLTLPAGSVSVPSVSFGDTGTGFYRQGLGAVSFTSGGVETARFTSNQLSLVGNNLTNIGALNFNSKGWFTGQSDGVWSMTNQAQNDFGRLQLGGTTASFPAIKRNGAGIDFRLADDSGYANIAAANITSSGTFSSANASTSQLSVFQKAYFGGTATSTFDNAGNLSLVSNGLTVGTSQLVVSGGNVGIGTASPGNLLTVNATPYATTSAVVLSASAATAPGLVVEGAASQTAALQSWVDSSGNILAQINPRITQNNATLFEVNPTKQLIQGTLARFNGYQSSYVDLHETHDPGLNTGLSGPALTFTGKWNSSGTVSDVTSTITSTPVNSLGATLDLSAGGHGGLEVYGFENRTSSVLVGTTSVTYGQLVVQPSYTGRAGVVVVANAGQTANLLDVQNSNLSSLFNVTGSGNVGIGTTTPFGQFAVYGGSASVPVVNIQGTLNSGSNSKLLNLNSLNTASVASIDDSGNVRAQGSANFNYNGSNVGNTAISQTSSYANFSMYNNAGVAKNYLDTNGVSYLNGGNVGIGTTSPYAMLSVAGAGAFNGGIDFNKASGATLNFNLTGHQIQEGVNSGGQFFVNDAGAGSGRMLIDTNGNTGLGNYFSPSNLPKNNLSVAGAASIGLGIAGDVAAPTGGLLVGGNVGIGTTTPGSSLAVSGQIRSAATGVPGTANTGILVTSQSQSGFNDGLHIGDTGNGAYKFLQSYGGALAINPTGNNVGIGTTSPASLLAVAGNTTVGANGASSYKLNFSNTTGTQYIYNRTYAGNNGLVVSANGADTFYFNQDGSFGATSVSASGGTFNGGTATLLTGTSAGSGDSFELNRSSVSGSGRLQLATGGTGDWWFGQNGNSSNFSFNSSTTASVLNLTPAGNVGIGTTTPIFKLQINGSGGLPNSSANNGIVRITNGTTANVLDFGADSASPFDTWLQSYDSRGTGLGVYPLALNPLGGNVGIGTTTPWSNMSGASALLDLTTNGVSRLVFHNSGTTQEARVVNTGTGLLLDVAGAATASNNYIAFQTGNTNSSYSATERMRIDSTGNVGIGTTTPWQKLSVTGNLSLTGALYDNNASAGSNGYVLQSTGSGITWVATSTLGISASGGGGGQLLGAYATSSPGSNVSVNFNGAAGSQPSFSGGVLTLPSNTSYIEVQVWGGGGGGGGASGTGGSAGGTSCFGTSNAASDCSQSTTLKATGGGGGGGASGASGGITPGAGGTGTGGDINMTGQGGNTDDGGISTTANGGGGVGGSAAGGGGGGGRSNGSSGADFGGGGSGSASQGGTNTGGGAGGGGGGYSYKLINTPSGTYYYSVGAGGAGGTAAGSGGAGGFVVRVYTTGISQGAIGSGTQGQFAFYNSSSATTSLSATSSLFLAQSGSIGVGSTTPAGTLSVASAYSSTTMPFVVSGALAVNGIRNLFGGYDASGALRTLLGVTDTATGGELLLNTKSGGKIHFTNGGTTANEFVTFDGSTGSVGVGTTTPWAQLSLASVAGSPAFAIGSTTTQFIVDKNGNVGIGTAVPSIKLQVAQNDTSIGELFSGNSKGIRFGFDTTASYIEGVDNTGTGSYQPLAFTGSLFRWGIGGLGEKMRIDTTGNVGIGTTSPFSALSVTGSAVASNLYLNSGTADAGTIGFSTSNGPALQMWGSGSAQSGKLFLQTAGATRMTIDASGNVGIGTTSPSISGLTGTTQTIQSTASGSFGVLELSGNATVDGGAAGVIRGFEGSNMLGGINFVRKNNLTNTGAINLVTTNAGVNATTMTLDYNGNVGIGNTGPSEKLDVIASNSGGEGGIRVLNNNTAASTEARLNLSTGTSNAYTLFSQFDGTTPYSQWATGAGVTGGIKIAPGVGNTVVTSGSFGIGTTTPFRKLSVTDTVSAAQVAIAYDGTRYTQLQTDAAGDYHINPSGQDAQLDDSNLWVCSGGSCPAGTPTGTGNLLVENKIGVGTSSPLHILDTYENSSQESTQQFMNVSTAAGASTLTRWRNSTDQLVAGVVSTGYSGSPLTSSVTGEQALFSTVGAIPLSIGTNATARMTIDSSGNVGIGTTTPSKQLAVQSLIYVGANGATGMGTATSTFQGDIKITGKLDVGTIDPPYTIDGVKYATYGSSMTGVKEETTDTIELTQKDASGKYAYTINFDDEEKGSDLWLFYQVTDLGASWQHLTVLLTPSFDGAVYYKKLPGQHKLVIYADQPGEVSMRLTGNRYDFTKWGNVRPDQDGNTEGTHVISSKPTVSQAAAAALTQ